MEKIVVVTDDGSDSTHSASRVPCVGEFINLPHDGADIARPVYRVVHFLDVTSDDRVVAVVYVR